MSEFTGQEDRLIEHLDSIKPHKGKPFFGKIMDASHYKTLVRDKEMKRLIEKRERILQELERREKLSKKRRKENLNVQPPLPQRGGTKNTSGLAIPAKAKAIISSVLAEYGKHWSDVINQSRKKELVVIRHKMWFLLKRSGYSLPQIGRIFDRDHTTILHGVRAINGTQRIRNSGPERSNARPICGSQQREPDGQEGDANWRQLAASEGGAERIT